MSYTRKGLVWGTWQWRRARKWDRKKLVHSGQKKTLLLTSKQAGHP